jgi:hypothetical protein
LIISIIGGAAIGALLSYYYFTTYVISDDAEIPFKIPPEIQGNLSLFVLVGQSNMVGHGDVLPEDNVTHPQIFLFGNDYRWHLAQEPIDRATNQVDKISADDDAGYSMGVSFARTLLEKNSDLQIGLIPCAKNSTFIEQWQRDLGDNTLYGSCLKRIQAASVVGEVEAVLFFQGEHDALAPDQYSRQLQPTEWHIYFHKFVRTLRTDLDSPELPIIFAQIGTTTRPNLFTHWQEIQNQQASIDIPNTGLVTTSDLPLKDFVHI